MKQLGLLVFAVALTVISAHDYCSEELCDGSEHIGCNNTGSFSPECPSDAVNVEVTDNLKKLILHSHNKYRDIIARGKVKRYEKAARMATLVWNNELAQLAAYNLRRCTFAHDQCRNTRRFNYAGQNLGRLQSKKDFVKLEKAITAIMKGFFDEHKDASMSYINAFRRHKSGIKQIGHFTQLVRDEAFDIGCAIIKFTKDKQFVIHIGCDYSLANIVGYPIYETSNKTASKCKKGINKQYPGLCSPKEIYANDLFYTLPEAYE